MEKVRVARYVAGKMPEYATQDQDDDEDEEIFDRSGAVVREENEASEESDDEIEMDVDDRRLKRLMLNKTEETGAVRRRIREPEIVEMAEDDVGVLDEDDDEGAGSEDISDDEIERRRILLKEKAIEREEERDILDVEEEMKSEEEEEEESEYETESESEDEMPRLKPVFIRKSDRVTVKERERIEEAETRLQENNKRSAQLRKKESVKVEKLLVQVDR